MRLLVPYRSLHPDTDRALREHAPHAVRQEIGPGLDAYYWWWADQWYRSEFAGQSLTIIEQDIVVGPEVAPEFASCPEPWCVFPFPGPAGKMLDQSLGCVRWSAELIGEHPDLPDMVGRIDDGDGVGPRDWRRLDVRIAKTLTDRGYTPHQHGPAVAHRHHYEPENRPCMCGACPD
jgi:hypothetical protein